MELVALMKRALERHAKTGLICRIRTIVVSGTLYKELHHDPNFAPPRYGIDIRHGNIKGRYFFEVLYRPSFAELNLTDDFLFVPYLPTEYEHKYLGKEKKWWDTNQAPLSIAGLIETDHIRGTWRQPFMTEVVEFLTEADIKEALKEGIDPKLKITNPMEQGAWTSRATDMTRIIYCYLEGQEPQESDAGMLYMRYISNQWRLCTLGKIPVEGQEEPEVREVTFISLTDPNVFVGRVQQFYQPNELKMGILTLNKETLPRVTLPMEKKIPNWLEHPICEDQLGWVINNQIHVSDPSGRGWYFPVYL